LGSDRGRGPPRNRGKAGRSEAAFFKCTPRHCASRTRRAAHARRHGRGTRHRLDRRVAPATLDESSGEEGGALNSVSGGGEAFGRFWRAVVDEPDLEMPGGQLPQLAFGDVTVGTDEPPEDRWCWKRHWRPLCKIRCFCCRKKFRIITRVTVSGADAIDARHGGVCSAIGQSGLRRLPTSGVCHGAPTRNKRGAHPPKNGR
jgi:hypothetical protein